MAAFPELRVEFGPTLLAAPFFALLALVAPAVILSVLRRERIGHLPLLVVFVLSMAAVLLAQSVAAFALAWEAMTLASAFLVGTYHERRAVRRALFSYLLVGHIGAACIITSLALLGAHAHSYRFADIARAASSLPADLRVAAVVLGLVGFGSKAGALPLQFWLPRAHPAAPASASALLSGVMLNIAVYGLLLQCLLFAAPLTIPLALTILIVGMITSLTGGLFAAVETDLKRLLAYSSIENIGIVVSVLGFAALSMACGMPRLAALAVLALLFHAIAHGVFKSLLFLAAGDVLDAAHTSDLEHLGGLLQAFRFGAPAFFVGCLAAAALPPLSGFAAEWLIFQAFLHGLATASLLLQMTSVLAIACLATASGMASIAFIKAFGVGLLGAPRSTHPRAPQRFNVAAVAPAWLAVVTLALGLAPALALRPLLALATTIIPSAGMGMPDVPPVPVWIAALPVAGAIGALLLARRRGVRSVETWTCGSPATARSQYTATAFSNPVRILLGALTHSFIDDAARNVAAVVQRLARRARILQAGHVRVYLAYMLVTLVAVLVIAR